MEKQYMVVAYGKSRKTGNLYSRAYLLKGDKKGTYGYLDAKDCYFTEDIRNIGTIITLKIVEE